MSRGDEEPGEASLFSVSRSASRRARWRARRARGSTHAGRARRMGAPDHRGERRFRRVRRVRPHTRCCQSSSISSVQMRAPWSAEPLAWLGRAAARPPPGRNWPRARAVSPRSTSPARSRRSSRNQRASGTPNPALLRARISGGRSAAKARRSATLPVDPSSLRCGRQAERELGERVVEQAARAARASSPSRRCQL